MRKHTAGFSVILVLVFSSVFLTLVTSLAGFIFIQQRVQTAKTNSEKAVQIAEAGLDYYKWFLAHNPGDLTDGTGLSGPYDHAYTDPETGEVGTFSLDITSNAQCDIASSIDIASTGYTEDDPSITRTVYGRYARPSVAEYAYILNSNVWAGDDRVIIGPYHSNGGIRMDGDNRSTVTSGLTSWQCTSTFGCSPSATHNGVFGIGDHPELWEYPVAPIDFQGITVDLSAMRDIAQDHGIYLNPYGGNSDHRGYRIVFNADGTITVYRVTQVDYFWGYHADTLTWERDYHRIVNQQLIDTYEIPSDCRVIFAEAKVWVEGVVNEKVTLAAANISNPNVDPDVIINGNLTYASSNGSDGITVIGEKSVLIPLTSPDTLNLKGIFIAQKGYFGRNHYVTSGSNQVPSQYDPYVQQSVLNLTGTIVSNGREGTKWTSNGSFVSGYAQRNNAYDRNLASEPPPLTPFVSNDYRFIEWREE